MQQTTFPISNSNISDVQDFIVSSSNKTAYNAILNWPQSWGVRPYEKVLIICAPKSSGKTILAKIWGTQTNALFIRKNHELTDNILSHHQTFIIDGFDNSWKEKDVLHYFNILHENNKFLLITTNKINSVKLADLSSRLNSVNKINIEMPDDELVKTLIFKLFSNYSIFIPNEVIAYLIKILPREFVTIVEMIKLINNFALCEKKKITIPLIKKCIDQL